MYKVFYNEKALKLTDEPLRNNKSLKFTNESVFDEAIDLLKNTSLKEINIYYHNIDKLWQKFQKHFSHIEAAGGVVTNSNNKILFIHRLGIWDLPKGKVEKGETTEMAALREVEEECGITQLELKEFIGKTYHLYFQKNLILKSTTWYAMEYDGNETPIPQKEEGIVLVEWKDKEEIQEILNSTYENIQIVLNQSVLNKVN